MIDTSDERLRILNSIIIILIALSFKSCSGKNPDNETGKIEPISVFKVDIQTTIKSEDEIDVAVKTNFPDNTILNVSAVREYRRKNNNEMYAGNLYSNSNAIVKDGKVDFLFKTNDREWIKSYEDIQKQNRKFDNSLTDIDYSTIKDSIEINILFTPKAEQRSTTYQITGENGEKLVGKDVEEYGGFKVLSKSVIVFDKFKK